jgi:hypothetical protein
MPWLRFRVVAFKAWQSPLLGLLPKAEQVAGGAAAQPGGWRP